MSDPYSIYKNNAINTASKEQLLLLLVDATVKFAKIARGALLDKDYKKAHENLIKVQDIYTELMSTLNVDAFDGGNQLFELYVFINENIAVVNIKKDIVLLDKILPLIIDIRDMWYEVYNTSIKLKK